MGKLLGVVVTPGFHEIAMSSVFNNIAIMGVATAYALGFLTAEKLLGLI